MRWMIAIAVMTSAVMELVDTKPVWPLPLQANHSLSSVRAGLRGYLVQQGESSAHAAHQSLALIYHQLLEQAATLSYLDGFRVILLFITVPFVWIMKKPQFKSPREAAE